ncbi:hypothetical protein [Streptomyces jumonjinensis]|uniref:hypothetical protein n=1 Tax=Streptomyces jumonjinensis TaxID=1945 RepID=UPI0037BCC2B8
MGHLVRRVPLDFDWPLEQPWEGFLLPARFSEEKCPDCELGSTPARDWLAALVQLLMMLPEDRATTHPYITALARRPSRAPGPEIAELTTGLAGRRGPFGHDSTDEWKAASKIIKAAGLDPDTWGICPACHGHASTEKYPGQRADYEAWEPTDPPTGDGWQLWETVSEGSPISPVLATADDLAAWMSHPDRGRDWVPQETAAKFISAGWAPTGAFGPGTHGVVSGVEWTGTQDN